MGKAFGMMACTTVVAAGLWITNGGDTPSRASAGVEYAGSPQRPDTNRPVTTGYTPRSQADSPRTNLYRPGMAIRAQNPENGSSSFASEPTGPIPFDSPAKRQAVTLLASARKEMKSGNFDIARKKALEADALGAKYAVFEDKPQLVLSELERRSGALTFTPQNTASPVVTAKAETTPGAPSQVQQTNFTPSGASPKEAALALLREARQEMQAGQLATARDKALKAQSYEVTYGLFEDNPELLLEDLARMASQIPSSPSAASSETQVAKGLVKEARQALMAGRYDEAYSKAVSAQQMPTTYGLLEDRPESVLKDLQVAMAGQPAVPTNNIAASNPSAPAPSTSDSSEAARARELVRQARLAMKEGQIDEAWAKASAAAQMNVAFTLLEDRPDLILSDIEQMQAGVQPNAPVQQTSSVVPSAETPSFDPNNDPSAVAKNLIREARQAMQTGQYEVARQKALQADALNVAYGPVDDRPELVLSDLASVTAPATATLNASPFGPQTGAPAMAAQAPAPQPAAAPIAPVYPAGMSAEKLYDLGLSHLTSGNQEAAREAFLMAYQNQSELDPNRRQNLQDFLTNLAPKSAQSGVQLVSSSEAAPGQLDLVEQQRAIQYDRLRSEVMNAIFRAERLKEKNPDQALTVLDQALANVESTDLGDDAAKNLVNSIRRTQASVASYKEQQAPLLEMKRKNQETLTAVERNIARSIKIEQELASLVDEYNTLMEERRYAEAEVIAKQAVELDPENPTAVVMEWKARFARRNAYNADLKRRKEDNYLAVLDDVEESAISPLTDDSIAYIDAKDWKKLSDRRAQFGGADNRTRTESELKIEESLSRPISLHFDNAPMTEVMKHIANLMGITVYVEVPALAEVGVESNTPVSIDVDGIMLKSALNLILGPMELGYSIEDEVLKITNRLRQQGKMTTVVYPVADLVVPLKSIIPTEYDNPLSGIGQNRPGGYLNPIAGANPILDMGAIGGLPGLTQAGVNAQLQVMDDGGNGVPSFNPTTGASSEDADKRTTRMNFDELSDLITRTIEPDSWQEFNGAGSLSTAESTLSLVIRQTQDVHDQVADLLGQLRRLQDLQVTIEVRFITVSDEFFEIIGVDFDFNVQDTVNGETAGLPPFGTPGATGDDDDDDDAGGGSFDSLNPFLTPQDSWANPSIVGLSSPGVFTNDLDVGFRQGSFDVGVPEFVNADPTAGAQMGLAILSDIEAFFFIRAAQGDSRSNVMFAPKVTLFNGQNASVQDIVVRPLVLGFTPIVGAGAVGFSPDIRPVPEGIILGVAAVISADRRYVRLAVIPQFSTITSIETFSVPAGSTSSIVNDTNIGGGAGNNNNQTGDVNIGTSNFTIQQPVIDFLTVQTVVSVPDGGTVLLGGIKRLQESRNMAGVPILNKLPYVSRLFKNSGVGRNTQSVMLMVTPRIIIQEEEEMLLGLPQ